MNAADRRRVTGEHLVGSSPSAARIPEQRSRNVLEQFPAGEPGRWTPMDYVAGCSRVLSAVIDWYIGPVWCRPKLRRAVTRAFMGEQRTRRGSHLVDEEIQGPHLHPQPEQVRVAVGGKRWDAEGLKLTGGNSTLIVIYCPRSKAWVFYLDSDPRTAVLIPAAETTPIARLLLGMRPE